MELTDIPFMPVMILLLQGDSVITRVHSASFKENDPFAMLPAGRDKTRKEETNTNVRLIWYT
jgi:hypothetical protein